MPAISPAPRASAWESVERGGLTKGAAGRSQTIATSDLFYMRLLFTCFVYVFLVYFMYLVYPPPHQTTDARETHPIHVGGVWRSGGLAQAHPPFRGGRTPPGAGGSPPSLSTWTLATPETRAFGGPHFRRTPRPSKIYQGYLGLPQRCTRRSVNDETILSETSMSVIHLMSRR